MGIRVDWIEQMFWSNIKCYVSYYCCFLKKISNWNAALETIFPLLPDGVHEKMSGGGSNHTRRRGHVNRSRVLLIYPLYHKSGSDCERDEARQIKKRWQMRDGWEMGRGRGVERGSEKEMSFTVLTLKILPRHFVEEYRPKPVRKEKLSPSRPLGWQRK